MLLKAHAGGPHVSHMPRLTLRTLLAYLDDTLEPEQARALGRKVAESPEARELIERIRRVTRRRGLTTPPTTGDDADVSDPNTVAEYLSDNLKTAQVRELEETCLTSDVHLAEVAACHQILTLVLTEPVRVPPSANQRMYLLVDSPASDPNRKPGKTLPIGGVAPPRPDHPESDEDAALLLGMKRYAASDSWAGRLGLVAAVGAAAAALVLAVVMALPRDSQERPETSTAAAPIPPRPAPGEGTPSPPPKPPEGGGLPVLPPPKPVDHKKEPDDSGVGKKPDDAKKVVVDPGPKEEQVAPPLPGDEVLGEVKTNNVLVLSRTAVDGGWVRIDPEKPVVRASSPVLALPGFRADVALSGVTVHLWGNVPEQAITRPMVMHSRVVFHPPATGFDADLTLDEGRVYLKTLKPGGAKVRVRLRGKAWDVSLRDATSDVLIQLHTAFVPGGKEFVPGAPQEDNPKSEVTLAVVAGGAQVHVPNKFKKFEGVAAGNQITWDSVRDGLSEPHPIPTDLQRDRVPSLDADYGKALQKVLTDAAQNLAKPDGIRVLLKERLTSSLTGNPKGPLEWVAVAFPTQFAAYSYAAITDGPDTPDLLKDMIEALGDRTRWYARQAAVTGLSAWVAQRPGNTELLVKAMTEKGWLEDDAKTIARLLRGYSSAALRDPAAVDQLVAWLDHEQIAVREAALGNLIAYFDPDAARVKELLIDVSARAELGAEAYQKLLRPWKARAEEIKKKMAEKKP
jgi:hypothetical protein